MKSGLEYLLNLFYLFFIMIVTTSIVVVLAVTFMHLFDIDMSSSQSKCLEKVGKTYCESKGYVYDKIEPMFDEYSFYCRISERSANRIPFKFLDKEIQECENA